MGQGRGGMGSGSHVHIVHVHLPPQNLSGLEDHFLIKILGPNKPMFHVVKEYACDAR